MVCRTFGDCALIHTLTSAVMQEYMKSLLHLKVLIYFRKLICVQVARVTFLAQEVNVP